MLATPTPRTAKGLNPTLIRQPPATYMRGQEFEMREPTQQPTMHMMPALSRTISHDSHHSQDTQYSHANVGTRANIGSVPVHQRGGGGGNGGLCCGICAGLACFECLECCC